MDPTSSATGARSVITIEQAVDDFVAYLVTLPHEQQRAELQQYLNAQQDEPSVARLIPQALQATLHPAPAPADATLPTADLLEDVVATVKRWVVCPSHAAVDAIALWVLHTYVFDQLDYTPYLAITSPEKRSGKSLLLNVLELMVARPEDLVDPTEAVVYRLVQELKPTLLLDEVDAIFSAKAGPREALRGILNAGFQRGKLVPRCVGEKNIKIERFDTYCPKALALIGKLPDTIGDRAIRIRLARRAEGEHVERFRYRRAHERTRALRESLTAWSAGVDLTEARPALPDELDDRSQDIWEPLLALADLAAGEWPDRARYAGVVLTMQRDRGDPTHGTRLLADCRRVFGEIARERVFTSELLEHLVAIEDGPWSDWYGKPITPRRLAKLLRDYDIQPGTVRIGEATAKGYDSAQFHDSWKRYTPTPPRKSVTTSQPDESAANDSDG